jgi:4-diphosphocytidyl-2-C-methyl-D-erythritol kinase
MRLRALAPGKVNLCLFLGGPRADGRHELVTLFQPVSLADEVTLRVLDGGGPDEVVCAGVEGENIAARALVELRARGWSGPRVRIEIDKRIPVAAGMAGGSADAGAVLRLASAVRPLVPARLVVELAGVLGADVPSQLAPGPALGTGAGDVVVPVSPRGELAALILPSEAQLPTGSVFAEADRLGAPRSPADLDDRRRALEAALRLGPELPVELLVNDLEPAARSLHAPIDGALRRARELGAEQAIVCGSGPTVAGLFWGREALPRARVAAAAAVAEFPDAVAVAPVDAGFAAVRTVTCRPRPSQ